MPVLAGTKLFVTVLPSPVSERFTTVPPAVKVSTDTAPVQAAVPPILARVNVVTFDILVPLTSVSATPIPVSILRVWPPPVTAPRVISPAVVRAWVLSVTLEPSVIAPHFNRSSDVLIDPLSVTTPPTPVVSIPPL